MSRRTNCNSTLKILQWNSNSLKYKIFELYDFLSENSIDVAIISETFYDNSDITPANPNYNVYRFDRITLNNRSSGGVAIFVRKTIKHNLLSKPKTKLLESLGVKIKLDSGAFLQLFAIYLPGGASNNEIRLHLKNDIHELTRNKRNYFIIGDFNAKHRLWNCNRANTAGTVLAAEYWSNRFLIHYPNEPTYFPSDPNKSPSYIDLVLHDGQFDLSDSVTHSSNSDHQMILHNIILNDEIEFQPSNYQLNFRAANWEQFRAFVSNEIQDSIPRVQDVNDTVEIDTMVANLENVMLQAQSRAVPLTRRTPYGVDLPLAIKQKIGLRNSLRRLVQRNPIRKPELAPQINELNKIIKRSIEDLINANFNHKLSQIPSNDNHRQLWQTSKFLRNRRNLMPHLQDGDTCAITKEEKAEALASQFAKNHENPLINENASFTNYVVSTVRRFKNNCDAANLEPEYATTAEVNLAIKNLKNAKAPGIDRVHNRLIKNLPSNAILLLTLIINCCLRLGYFPNSWKQAKVIAIRKPNKPANLPSSYRPISLVSSLSKILERVILSRINAHLDEFQILPDQQHGFRNSKSTVTQLNRIIDHVKNGFSARLPLSTGMVLVDIEKAFDRVWHDGLVYKLIKLNFPHYITKIIFEFLQNRNFHVNVLGATSTNHELPFGTPQGCVLSPTLYNIYTHDIPTDSESSIALFADDTALFTSSRFAKQITKRLEKNTKKLIKYFTRWKIKLNESKTQAIFFSRRRTRQLPTTPFRIGSSLVDWLDSVVYLGLVLDKRLTFRSHIQHVLQKTQNTVRILYSMLSRRSKLNQASKVLLYKVGIRPMFTYAAPIINNVANVHKKRLQICQNKILKMAMNMRFDTATATVHELAEVPMVGEFLESVAANYQARHL